MNSYKKHLCLLALLATFVFACAQGEEKCSKNTSSAYGGFDVTEEQVLYGGYIAYKAAGSEENGRSCQVLVKKSSQKTENTQKVIVYTSRSCLLQESKGSPKEEEFWLALFLLGDSTQPQEIASSGYLSLPFTSEALSEWRTAFNTTRTVDMPQLLHHLRWHWAPTSAALSETTEQNKGEVDWKQSNNFQSCSYINKDFSPSKRHTDALEVLKRQKQSMLCFDHSDLTAFEGEILTQPHELDQLKKRAKVLNLDQESSEAFGAWDQHLSTKMATYDLPILKEALSKNTKNLSELTSLNSYVKAVKELWRSLPIVQKKGDQLTPNPGLHVFSNTYARKPPTTGLAVGFHVAPIVKQDLSRLMVQRPGGMTNIIPHSFTIKWSHKSHTQDIQGGHHVAYGGSMLLLGAYPLAVLYSVDNAILQDYDPDASYGVPHLKVLPEHLKVAENEDADTDKDTDDDTKESTRPNQENTQGKEETKKGEEAPLLAQGITPAKPAKTPPPVRETPADRPSPTQEEAPNEPAAPPPPPPPAQHTTTPPARTPRPAKVPPPPAPRPINRPRPQQQRNTTPPPFTKPSPPQNTQRSRAGQEILSQLVKLGASIATGGKINPSAPSTTEPNPDETPVQGDKTTITTTYTPPSNGYTPPATSQNWQDETNPRHTGNSLHAQGTVSCPEE